MGRVLEYYLPQFSRELREERELGEDYWGICVVIKQCRDLGRTFRCHNVALLREDEQIADSENV